MDPASDERPGRDPVKVLVTGASGLIGSALCDALLARGRRGRRPHPRPRQGARRPTRRHLARLGADPGTARRGGLRGRRRRRQPGRREDRPALDRRGEEEDHREPPRRHPQPGRGDRRARAASPRGPGQPVGGRLLRRPRRRRSSTSRTGPAARASTPRSSSSGSRRPTRSTPTGVRLAIVRTGQVLDAGGGMLAELLPPFKLGVGGPLAGGDQYVSWIHVDDEVGILLWALDNESVSGVVNATAPNPVTNSDFSKALGRALERPGGAAGPRLRARPQIRRRVRQGAARRPAGDARSGRWSSATSSSTRISTRRSTTCSSAASRAVAARTARRELAVAGSPAIALEEPCSSRPAPEPTRDHGDPRRLRRSGGRSCGVAGRFEVADARRVLGRAAGVGADRAPGRACPPPSTPSRQTSAHPQVPRLATLAAPAPASPPRRAALPRKPSPSRPPTTPSAAAASGDSHAARLATSRSRRAQPAPRSPT